MYPSTTGQRSRWKTMVISAATPRTTVSDRRKRAASCMAKVRPVQGAPLPRYRRWISSTPPMTSPIPTTRPTVTGWGAYPTQP